MTRDEVLTIINAHSDTAWSMYLSTGDTVFVDQHQQWLKIALSISEGWPNED